jgi:hypothetical protein
MNKKPFMAENDFEVIDKEVLSRLGKSEKFMALEWGSGSSTAYYIDLLNKKGKDFEWHSVEHNPKWAKKVEEEIGDKRFHMHLFDYKAYSRGETRNLCMKDYVECPRYLNKKFDLIIIDGRCRRRCLIEAKELLKEDGIVFLHDADRGHYGSSKSLFKNGKMISEFLWGATPDGQS